MSERQEKDQHPVLLGLAALLGVGLFIGLLAGVGAWVGADALGLGNATAVDSSSDGATLYLPTPSPTDNGPANPLMTQTPGKYPSAPSQPSDSASGATSIQLQSVESTVTPMAHIDFSGSYPGGDGAILQFQRLENGTWSDFGATCSVSGGTFSTWIQTGRSGPNKFRVIDSDTKAVSNAVTITVG